MASDATLTVCADPAALAETAANLIVDIATEAVRERGRFMLCLAGGETPRKTYARLALPAFSERVGWDRTWVFFGDERVVPPDHAESNYRMAHETLLARVPIAPDQILRMRGEDADADRAAAAYAVSLTEVFRTRRGELPRFDLVLLGLGVDGHTASLFPGSPVLREVFRPVAAVHVTA
ncbi:MAG: 6-phosphogluconolactonase, partial [Candidatus Rokuibacteriota bacterium]